MYFNLNFPVSAVVSPTALRPFRRESGCTPRSILKNTRLRSGSHTPPAYDSGLVLIQKLEKITFSPYNSVKIIAHRSFSNEEPDENGEPYRWKDPSEDDSFEEEDEEEDDEDE